MALLKYLQRTSTLPKPQGPLSRIMPSSSVAAANEEVKQVLDEEGKKPDDPTVTSKRSPYQRFTPEEKLQIGKRAANRRYGTQNVANNLSCYTCLNNSHGIWIMDITRFSLARQQLTEGSFPNVLVDVVASIAGVNTV